MTDIIVVGHGYIGTAISLYLKSDGIDHGWLSHLKALDIDSNFSGTIINAAGYTGVPNVDTCEIKKTETIDGNIVFPVRLHERLTKARIIHIASGCIYNGYRWFSEEDEPNFTFTTGSSFYSGCKAYAETLIKKYMDETNRSVILRIRMPFDSRPDPKNLLTKFEKYDRIVDVTNSMTNLKDLCYIVSLFAIGDISSGGIFNCTNRGAVTHREVLDMMGLKKTFVNIEEFDRELVVAPRSHCTLSTDKLSRYVYVPHVIESLTRTIEEYKNYT